MFKIFTIVPRAQYIKCVGIMLAMLLGAVLEALGISAILPMISIIGDVDFLDKHPYAMEMAERLGVVDHTKFIITFSLFYDFVLVEKYLYCVAI